MTERISSHEEVPAEECIVVADVAIPELLRTSESINATTTTPARTRELNSVCYHDTKDL